MAPAILNSSVFVFHRRREKKEVIFRQVWLFEPLYCWAVQIGWWQVRRWTVEGLTTSRHLVLLWHFTRWWIEVVRGLLQSSPIVLDCYHTLGIASGTGGPASRHDPGQALSCLLHVVWHDGCCLQRWGISPPLQRHEEVVQGLRQKGEACLLGDAVSPSEEPFQMVKLWVYLNHCSSQKHWARRGIWHPWQPGGSMNTTQELEAQIKHI